MPTGTRATQLPDNGFSSYFLTVFGLLSDASYCLLVCTQRLANLAVAAPLSASIWPIAVLAIEAPTPDTNDKHAESSEGHGCPWRGKPEHQAHDPVAEKGTDGHVVAGYEGAHVKNHSTKALFRSAVS